jgi:hypothetical protein
VPAAEPAPAELATPPPVAAPEAVAAVPEIASPAPAAAPQPVVAAVETPATAAVADADATALASLSAGVVFDSAVADYSRLLQLWGVAPVGDSDLASGSLNLQTIAESRGLRYFAVELNDALLAVLDLPSVVELVAKPEEGVRYVLLRNLDRTGNTVRVGNSVAMTLTGFNSAWNGKAHVLFKDPEGLHYDLAPGAGGPAVRKLQSMLTAAGVLDATPTGLYDDLTENAVRRFQEAHHVTVDGVAGPITQILLYNSLARFERPTLALAPGAMPAARAQGSM